MTKADLISAVEKQANISHKLAEKIVNISFECMIKALYRNDRIEIRGFGSFCNRNYKAYEGRNPKSGNVVKVDSKKVPFFKVGKELKKMVDEGKDSYVIREGN
jgi:integration host factor subunit beta